MLIGVVIFPMVSSDVENGGMGVETNDGQQRGFKCQRRVVRGIGTFDLLLGGDLREGGSDSEGGRGGDPELMEVDQQGRKCLSNT